MKKHIIRTSENRWDIEWDHRGLGWMVDFGPDSVLSLRLRKSDMLNFALNNEGNLYNNLINKAIYRNHL